MQLPICGYRAGQGLDHGERDSDHRPMAEQVEQAGRAVESLAPEFGQNVIAVQVSAAAHHLRSLQSSTKKAKQK